MRGLATIVGRELRGYFNSVIAYIFIIVFLLVSCGLFMTTFFLQESLDMRSFFGVLPFILLVFLPAVSMRLWAEERALKTDELLLTFPLKTRVFVLGKFLAAFLFTLFALAGTLTLPVMLAWLGDPDGGVILSGYLGAVLLSGFLLALGLMISGFAREQIVAFVLALAAGFTLFLLGTEVVGEQIDGWVPGLGTLLAETFGVARRFDEFARGVVPLESVFFFLAWTTFFLIVNALVIERRGRSLGESTFAGGLGASGVFTAMAVLVVATVGAGRLDLTEDRVFTISPATGEILADLKDTVRITYYISPEEKMPTPMKRLGRDVRDKLQELSHASEGRLEVRLLDPTDPGVAEKAQEKGVEPFPLQSLEQDEFAVKMVYSTLILSYLDKDEVVPQVTPANFPNLEYEVVSRIYRLLRDDRAVVAFDGAVEELDPQMVQAFQQMGRPVPPPRELYREAEALVREGGEHTVRKIRLSQGDPIPEEAETLVLLEPRGLDEEARAGVARFLHAGGNVIIALQPWLFSYEPSGEQGVRITAQEPEPSGLAELLGWYGLDPVESVLMDTEQEMLSIPTRRRIGFIETVVETPVKMPIQVRVVRDNIDTTAPAVGQVGSLLYLWGTGLGLEEETLKERGLEAETLFTSTSDAWYVLPGGTLTLEDIDASRHESVGPEPLAVMVRGRFPRTPWNQPEASAEEDVDENGEPTAQPDAPTPGDEPDGETEEGSEGRLLVVGSARMFTDGLIRGHDNALFLLNAVDTLTLGPELVNIRGKSLKPRTYENPSAAAKVWWRFFSVLLVPLLVAAGGLLRAYIRRRAREQYQAGLQMSSAA